MKSDSRIYQIIEETLARTIAGAGGFAEFAQIEPVTLPPGTFKERRARLGHLRTFLNTTLAIFHDVVKGQRSPLLSRLLFNDAPEFYGRLFHADLPPEVWTVPTFFRTDESKNGMIFEIQSPGSGWGDLQLLREAYRQTKGSLALGSYKPSEAISLEIVKKCQKDSPSVLHLLDNSSNPVSMRFLIATTQPPLRYWGYENSVRNGHCDFVRSHSFYGLVAENLFRRRLRSAGDGQVTFDLPPLLVFDQKVPLCLPFLEETRALFTDDVRKMLVYSYPVQESGFRDSDGAWITVSDFIKRPASQRRYFLKYAGSDVSVNWGSRGVFRLNDTKVASLMNGAADDAKRNRFWLIQPEISEKEAIDYFDRQNDKVVHKEMNSKCSCFYGPTQLIGIRTMHRQHFKVHGQPDTVVGLCVPEHSSE